MKVPNSKCWPILFLILCVTLVKGVSPRKAPDYNNQQVGEEGKKSIKNGGGDDSESLSLSSLGFHVLPHTILKIDDALSKNATIILPEQQYSVSEDTTDIRSCGESCSQTDKCNLFVFSKRTSKCVLFDCKTPSVCSFEDNHSMYVSAVKVKQSKSSLSSGKYTNECFPKFRCVSSGECVPLSYTCDKYVDCEDRSDELGCYNDFDAAASKEDLSPYEKAYQKHTSSSKNAEEHSTSIYHSYSSQQHRAAIPEEAIPEEAKVITGNSNDGRLIPSYISNQSKFKSTATNNTSVVSSTHNQQTVHNKSESSLKKLKPASSFSDGQTPPHSETQLEKVSRQLKNIDNEVNSNDNIYMNKVETEREVDDPKREESVEKDFQISKNKVREDVVENYEHENSSKHPFFDWLVGFLPEERVQKLTILDIYKLTLRACLSPPDRGLCADSTELNYYYNSTQQKCLPYHFTICAVGMNKFNTEESCFAICDSVKDTDTEQQSSYSGEEKDKEVFYDVEKKNTQSNPAPGLTEVDYKDDRLSKSSLSAKDDVKHDAVNENASGYVAVAPKTSSSYYEPAPASSRYDQYSRSTSHHYPSSRRKNYPYDTAKDEVEDGSYSRNLADSYSEVDWTIPAPSWSRDQSEEQSLRWSRTSNDRRHQQQLSSFRREEPVYWEEIHHSNGRSSVQGKTDPEEFNDLYSRLSLEKPALVDVASEDYNERVSSNFKEEVRNPSYEWKKDFDFYDDVDGDEEVHDDLKSDEKDHRSSLNHNNSAIELSAAIPLILGLSLVLLIIVLLIIRCYFCNKYNYSYASAATTSRFKWKRRLFKDPDDYLVDGMYL